MRGEKPSAIARCGASHLMVVKRPSIRSTRDRAYKFDSGMVKRVADSAGARPDGMLSHIEALVPLLWRKLRCRPRAFPKIEAEAKRCIHPAQPRMWPNPDNREIYRESRKKSRILAPCAQGYTNKTNVLRRQFPARRNREFFARNREFSLPNRGVDLDFFTADSAPRCAVGPRAGCLPDQWWLHAPRPRPWRIGAAEFGPCARKFRRLSMTSSGRSGC